jgi:hypothetical protein
MIRILARLIGAAVALTLGLAACGGSPAAPSPSPPVAPSRSLQPSATLQPSAALRPLTWSDVSMPGDSSDIVVGVSCASPAFCVAVGQSGPNATSTTLIETWDGKHWSITPSPNSGASGLNGVACLNATNCVAVGHIGSIGQALVETWDGRRWSITPSPKQGNGVSTLFAVSCAGPAFCTAVGFYETGPPLLTHVQIEMWNGIRWSVRSGPSPGSGDSSFTDVSCTSTTFCLALGSAGPARHGLIETWDGTHWSIIAAPSPIGRSGYASLTHLSCTSPAFCMAIGGYSQSTVSLTEIWNGIRWSNINNPAYSTSEVGAVSCTSPAFCVGAGGNALIETWNGTAWSIRPSPGGSSASGLTGVSCASPSFCATVGFYPTPAPLGEIGRPAPPPTASGHS